MDGGKIKLLRNVCFVTCIGVYICLAWHSDDAYHAYTMAKNLVEGNGFVYNVGERVNASTCPLFTLCVAAIYFACGNMFISGLVAGIFFSGITAWLVLYKVAKSEKQIIFSTIALIGSTCYVAYTTAGLENSLLYFLSAVFYYIFFTNDEYTPTNLFFMGLMVGLTGVTRMDAVLFFVLPVCYAYLCKRKNCSFTKCAGIGAVALSPFILWEIFSLLYYGFFIPNTAFAKLGTGIPRMEYLERGIHFVQVSCLYDVFLAIVPIVYIILCIWNHNLKRIISSISIMLYFAYVIYIGGDFMVGRHLTVIYFIAAFGCLFFLREFENNKGINNIVIGTILLALCVNIFIPDTYVDQYMFDGIYSKYGGGVADERAFYFSKTSLLSNIKQVIKGEELLVREAWGTVDYTQFEDARGVVLEWAPGIIVYYDSKNIHLVDNYALGDPLLSKLPVEYVENWRIGHTYRKIPKGYKESLATMTNQIEDKFLHEYYDKLLLIVRGDLFCKERIKTIVEMNLGKYDYLLKQYIDNP